MNLSGRKILGLELIFNNIFFKCLLNSKEKSFRKYISLGEKENFGTHVSMVWTPLLDVWAKKKKKKILSGI